MRKAERGVGSGRFVWIALAGSLGVALAGCGGSDSGSSATAAAATPGTSTSSPNVGGTASGTGSTSPSGGGTASGTGSTSPSGGGTAPGTGSTSPNGSGTAPGTGTGSTATTPPPTISTSSITLGWVPPTENSNGTPITDLAGYKIHYGTKSADYSQTVSVANAGLTRYVVDNLSRGTYYFAITAYNAQGIESALSGEIATTVN